MMSSYILLKENLPKFITELTSKYKVLAPVDVNDVTLFKEIKSPKEINMKYSNSKVQKRACYSVKLKHCLSLRQV